MWDSLEDWQKEKLSKLKVTKEIFDVQSEQEKENVLFCLKK